MNNITNPLVISNNESIGEIEFWWRHIKVKDMKWNTHYCNKNPCSTFYTCKTKSRPIIFDKLTNEFKVFGEEKIWVFDFGIFIPAEKPVDAKLSPETWGSLQQKQYLKKKVLRKCH